MPTDPKVTIIGGGVSALTTGITLLKNGFTHVKIIAEKLHPKITSSVAAAMWVPYKVAPIDKAREWSEKSYATLVSLSESRTPGVSWINCTQLFTKAGVKLEWADIAETAAPPEFLPDGYETMITTRIPLMDVSLYLPWLMTEFQGLGGEVEQKRITNFLEISTDCDLIINCAGLGTTELLHDEQLYPVSGQVVICELPENLDYSIACDEDPKHLTYIIPRQASGTCVIGGTAIEGDTDPTPDEATTREILERASAICPFIRTDIPVLNVVKGFRPTRAAVRVEASTLPDDDETPVIHNYGHGGGGYAISWGCAEEVLKIARDLNFTYTSSLRM